MMEERNYRKSFVFPSRDPSLHPAEQTARGMEMLFGNVDPKTLPSDEKHTECVPETRAGVCLFWVVHSVQKANATHMAERQEEKGRKRINKIKVQAIFIWISR